MSLLGGFEEGRGVLRVGLEDIVLIYVRNVRVLIKVEIAWLVKVWIKFRGVKEVRC